MDYEKVWTYLAGLASGLLPYMLNKFSDRFISTPKLKILSADPDLIEPQMWYINGIRRGEASLSVEIINEDIFVAKGCRLYLTELELLDDVPEKFSLRTSIPMTWSLADYGVAMINDANPKENPSGDQGKFDLPKGLRLKANLVSIWSELQPVGEYRDKVFRAMFEKDDTWFDDPTEYVPQNYERSVKATMPIDFTSGYRLEPCWSYRIKLVVTADNAEPFYFCVDVKFEEVQGLGHIRVLNKISGRHLETKQRLKSTFTPIRERLSGFQESFEADRREGRI